ncbi:MAG TPA: hypothetical protein VGH81_11755 [Rudaea sp.]
MALAINCLSLGAFATFAAGMAVSAAKAAPAQARAARAMRTLVFINVVRAWVSPPVGMIDAVASLRNFLSPADLVNKRCSKQNQERLNHEEHEEEQKKPSRTSNVTDNFTSRRIFCI